MFHVRGGCHLFALTVFFFPASPSGESCSPFHEDGEDCPAQRDEGLAEATKCGCAPIRCPKISSSPFLDAAAA